MESYPSCGQTILKYFRIAVQNKTEFLKALNYAYNARWGAALEVIHSGVLGIKWWVLRSTGNI